MKREAPYNIQRIKRSFFFYGQAHPVYFDHVAGCSLWLFYGSFRHFFGKARRLKEQEALSAAWASDSREKRSFRRIRMDMEDHRKKR